MNDDIIQTMPLAKKHIDALDVAQKRMSHANFCPYLELKNLFANRNDSFSREQFKRVFTNYYGLNVGGLTDEFKDRFFKILFDGKVIVGGRPDFSSILVELSEIKNRKGGKMMPFSFVSKLVATHCESSPIFDRHVSDFFAQWRPAASVDKDKRIRWFINFLDSVGKSYAAWASHPQIIPILGRLKDRDKGLADCHSVRLMDFLVWKVGSKKLLTK